MNNNIRAVFFDLHGVLVDAEDWYRSALDVALINVGMSLDAIIPIYSLDGSAEQLRHLVEHGQLEDHKVDDVLKKRNETLSLIIEDRCRPNTRIIDVLNYLRSMNIRLAVVTNGSRPHVEKILEFAKITKYFELIITRDDVNKIKPHPLPYLVARYQMGLKEDEVLAIDNTTKGILSAIDARCRIWRLKSYEELNVRNVIKILNSLQYTL